MPMRPLTTGALFLGLVHYQLSVRGELTTQKDMTQLSRVEPVLLARNLGGHVDVFDGLVQRAAGVVFQEHQVVDVASAESVAW
jgi:hypothetical protein